MECYIRCVTAQRANRAKPRRQSKRAPDELLVAVRCKRKRKADCVALQWHDGAGELHIELLSPAQSWPYLN